MITLLASLTGFISSVIPEVLKLFKDKNDKEHELKLVTMQMNFAKMKHSQRLEEIRINADSTEQIALYKTYRTGIIWIDALNGTVRPIMAYSFFSLYSFLKYTQYKILSSISENMIPYMDIIWSTDDQAIFAGIISFYFGQRTFSKLMRNNSAGK